MRCDTHRCMINDKMIRDINRGSRQYGWSSANYTDFWGKKLSDGLTLKTGTLLPEGRVCCKMLFHFMFKINIL